MSPDDTLQLYREAMGDTGGENRDMEDRVERLRACASSRTSCR